MTRVRNGIRTLEVFVKSMTSTDVFIIESLPAMDINEGRLDGKILYSQLKLMGRNPWYRYVISLSDLGKALNDFKKSKCRFLHFSLHGSKTEVRLAGGHSLGYAEFASLLKGYMALKRITFSACELGNKTFCESIFRENRGLHSVVAPILKLPFSQGSAFWIGYYTLLESEAYDAHKSIKRAFLDDNVLPLARIFNTPMKYAIYRPAPSECVEICSTKVGRTAIIKPW